MMGTRNGGVAEAHAQHVLLAIWTGTTGQGLQALSCWASQQMIGAHHCGVAEAHAQHVLVAAGHDELVLPKVRQQAQQAVAARARALRLGHLVTLRPPHALHLSIWQRHRLPEDSQVDDSGPSDFI